MGSDARGPTDRDSLAVRLRHRAVGCVRCVRRVLRGSGQETRGGHAERAAARYLRRQGYRIIQRNLRTKLGEIDIVAEQNGWLVVVEVRSRSEDAPLSPRAGLTRAKQRKLRQLTEQLRVQYHLTHLPVRVDLVEVIMSEPGSVRSIEVLEGLAIGDS